VGDTEDFSAAVRAGDHVALSIFIRESQADVWHYCAYLARGLETDDLVQETYLRALRALPKYQGRAPMRVWLLSIARRVCVDAIRTAQRRRRISTLFSRPAAQADAVEQLAINALIDSLPHDQREAFVLTQLLGYSYAEVAAISDVPVGTIRSRIARARNDLHQQLDADTG
jgi:RNA polymerase sigma-70 factor, ECF subfamily